MPELLTIDQVVERVSRSRPTVYRRIHDGRLPAVHDGRRLLVDAADAERVFSPTAVTPRRRGQMALDELERMAEVVAAAAPTVTEQRRERLRALLLPVIGGDAG